MATGACRLLRIQQRGYSLRFHPANLSSQLWIDPNEREESLSFLRAYLKPGDHVIDVGANVGDTVLTASTQAGRSGRVVGIEAHPTTFDYLRENVALNGADNVELIHSAVGAVTGTARFSDDRRDDMNRVDGGDLQMPIERLDRLVPGAQPVALLKVDVEGYEKFVFDGATEVLRRTQCVYFEVSAVHFRRFGYCTRNVIEMLRADGFQVFNTREPGHLSRVDADFDTESFENLVALRDVQECRRRTGWAVRCECGTD